MLHTCWRACKYISKPNLATHAEKKPRVFLFNHRHLDQHNKNSCWHPTSHNVETTPKGKTPLALIAITTDYNPTSTQRLRLNSGFQGITAKPKIASITPSQASSALCIKAGECVGSGDKTQHNQSPPILILPITVISCGDTAYPQWGYILMAVYPRKTFLSPLISNLFLAF